MLQLGYAIDDTVTIDETTYNLNLTFDNVIRLFDLIKDVEIDNQTKIEVGLEMLLGVCFLVDIDTQSDILSSIINEFLGESAKDNQPVDIAGNPMPTNESDEKVYSLKEDADFIYASFMQDYGMDLIKQQGKLHWYKFVSLLTGLKGDTKFREVVEIRTMELPTGKGAQKQREQIKKMKRQFALKGDD